MTITPILDQPQSIDYADLPLPARSTGWPTPN